MLIGHRPFNTRITYYDVSGLSPIMRTYIKYVYPSRDLYLLGIHFMFARPWPYNVRATDGKMSPVQVEGSRVRRPLGDEDWSNLLQMAALSAFMGQ